MYEIAREESKIPQIMLRLLLSILNFNCFNWILMRVPKGIANHCIYHSCLQIIFVLGYTPCMIYVYRSFHCSFIYLIVFNTISMMSLNNYSCYYPHPPPCPRRTHPVSVPVSPRRVCKHHVAAALHRPPPKCDDTPDLRIHFHRDPLGGWLRRAASGNYRLR